MQKIQVARLHDGAILPTRKHPEDAGMDIYAYGRHTIGPRSHGIIPSGITIDVPEGYVALLKPKGRNDHLLGAGVVDAGYQGEILVKIFNPVDTPLAIEHGAAIGQMILIPIITPAVEEIKLSEIHTKTSQRAGTGGIVDQHES